MSRVAKNPVAIPVGVDVTLAADEIVVKGPLGTLKQKQNSNVKVVKDGAELKVEKGGESLATSRFDRACEFHRCLGLSLSLPLAPTSRRFDRRSV